jgi:hypothetical protein
MQSAWGAQPSFSGGMPVGAARARAGHPVARYALLFGLLNGLFAALQVAASVEGAVENQAQLTRLYYGTHGVGFDPVLLLGWIGPLLTASYGICLLGFAGGLWLAWNAGRFAAAAAGSRAAGAPAGLLASLLGSAIWIAASVAAVLIAHTDGSLTGVFLTTPDRGTGQLGTELAGLLSQEVVAALLTLGLAALAGRIGAGRAMMRARAAGGPLVGPPTFLPPAPGAWPAYPPHPPRPPDGTSGSQPYPPTAPGAIMYPGYPGYPAYSPRPAAPPPWNGASGNGPGGSDAGAPS